MKRTQFKDSIRNIRKQFVSFLSIIIIAFLAVVAYLGINYASEGIAQNASIFYNDNNFRDAEIVSTLLLSEDDLSAIRNVDGVNDAEGIYLTSGMLEKGNRHRNVDVISLTERINTFQLLQGDLPKNEKECVIEKYLADSLKYSVGDTISIKNKNGNTPKYLKNNSFVITGIALHPDHGGNSFAVPGNRNIIVTPEAFDTEVLDNCYMKALVDIKTDETDRFSKKYSSQVNDTAEKLKTLAEERETLRYESIIAKYQTEIDNGQKKLNSAKEELDNARSELDKNQKKLADAKTELEAAEKKLNSGKEEAESSKKDLDSALEKLNDGESKIADSKKQLDDAKALLDGSKAELDAAKSKLDIGREKLISSYQQIEEAKTEMRDALRQKITSADKNNSTDINWYEGSAEIDPDDPSASATAYQITDETTIDLTQPLREGVTELIDEIDITPEQQNELIIKYNITIPENKDPKSVLIDRICEELEPQYNEFSSAAIQWDEQHQIYIDGLDEYNRGMDKYNQGLSDYENGLEKYNASRKELDDGLKQYNEGLEKYNAAYNELTAGQKIYDDKQKEYNEGLSKFEDGQNQYEEGSSEYASGEEQLEKAKNDMADQDKCRWIILDMEGNTSYLLIQNNIQSIRNMGITFSLVFILVGAMVIYATLGRIVDEQRKLIGATKALGFFNREILGKYLIYGISGTILGMLAGTGVAYFVFQKLVSNAYANMYTFEVSKPGFNLSMTLIVWIAGIAVSGLTVFFACSNLIHSTAISLLQGKVPQKNWKTKRSSKRSSSLYSRLVLLNILSDKKRVTVSVVSIAGCCTLLVAGFTLKYSVRKAIDYQFSSIQNYNIQFEFDNNIPSSEQKIQDILNEAGTEWTETDQRTIYYDAGGKISATNLICGDISELSDFYNAVDVDTDEQISDDGTGIWIFNRAAEINNFSAGDDITLFDNSMNEYRIQISGIYNLYMGRQMIMSREAYMKAFGAEAKNNTFYVKTSNVDKEALKDKIKAVEGVEKFKFVEDDRDYYLSNTDVLNFLALLMTGMAGMMAYFILLNNVNMYVNQKKKELIIMRVNGFSVREVLGYVSYELIASTAAGILVGLATGSMLGYRMIKLMETDMLHFVRSIQFEAWGFAIVITFIFSSVIGYIALRKIPHYKLTDAAQ